MSRLTAARQPILDRPLLQEPRRLRWPAALSITMAATILGFVVTFPLILHLDSVVYGTPGDSTGTIATFWWWAYAIQHGKPLLDNTMWGAPFGAGWAQVPFAVLPLIIFAPLSLFIGPTVAYNLGVLSSFPLTALFMYLLARRLQLSLLAASFSALAFAFLPYHQGKATGHMFQAHMELFPALLLLLVRWWQGGSRWNLAGAGAVLGVAVWIDYQFALIMVFLTGVFFIVSLLLPRLRGVSFLARLRQHAAGALATTAALLPFLPPAVLLGHRPGSGGGYAQSLAGTLTQYQRDLGVIDLYSVRPWEYLMPWPANPLVPQAVRNFQAQHLHGSNGVEQAQVLGYTVIALGLVAMLLFRPRFPVVLGLAVAVAGALLALPADVHAFGLTLLGPAALLNHVVPFIRVYARFGVLVMLGATLLAGLGFAVFEASIRKRHLGWLAIVPFLLVALEFNAEPPTHTTTLFPAPDEYSWLRNQPAGILIEYPVVASSVVQEVEGRQYTLYQQVHLHPLFNGAAPGTQADQLASALDPYFRPGIAAQLRKLGIRYVFVHRHDYQAVGYETPQAVPGLQFIGAFDHGDVDAFIVSDAAEG